MQVIDRLKALLPGRSQPEPAPPRGPEGTRIYAVGDIHGRVDLLGELRARIAEDAAAHSQARRVIVYLGDYVDRGPASREVIETLAGEPLPGFQEVHLLGNHEDMFMRFLGDVRIGPVWFLNGARATLASYGVDVPDAADDETAFADIQARINDQLPAHHRAFLRGLRPWHLEGDYLFVHAGLRPGRRIERQDIEDLIWIRDDFLNSDADFGAVVVHGHSIREAPEFCANRIGIDTGAYRTGVLTALALEGEARTILQTGQTGPQAGATDEPETR